MIQQQTQLNTCNELFVFRRAYFQDQFKFICERVFCSFIRIRFQDQYKFIYDSLEEYCRGIDSRFPVSDLANKIKEKTVKDKKIKKNAYAFEYAVRGRVENPVKARVSDILLPKSRSFTFALLTY